MQIGKMACVAIRRFLPSISIIVMHCYWWHALTQLRVIERKRGGEQRQNKYGVWKKHFLSWLSIFRTVDFCCPLFLDFDSFSKKQMCMYGRECWNISGSCLNLLLPSCFHVCVCVILREWAVDSGLFLGSPFHGLGPGLIPVIGSEGFCGGWWDRIKPSGTQWARSVAGRWMESKRAVIFHCVSASFGGGCDTPRAHLPIQELHSQISDHRFSGPDPRLSKISSRYQSITGLQAA